MCERNAIRTMKFIIIKSLSYEEEDCRDCGEGDSSRAHGISDGHHDHELHGLRPILNEITRHPAGYCFVYETLWDDSFNYSLTNTGIWALSTLVSIPSDFPTGCITPCLAPYDVSKHQIKSGKLTTFGACFYVDGVMKTRQEPSFSPRSTYFLSVSWVISFWMADLLMPSSSCMSDSVNVGWLSIALSILP